MLTQYRLELRADSACGPPRAEWGYWLYAALLGRAPASFAREAHRDGATPLSQHLCLEEGRILWVVNLLGEESEAQLGPALESARSFALQHLPGELAVERRERQTAADADALFAQASRCGGRHALRVRTPAAFKSRGQYVALPGVRLILQSLVKKWNGCFPGCPIEDEDGEGLQALADGLCCRRFCLRDARFTLKGAPIPGFVGTLELQNHLEGFHRQLANALLIFSDYAGIGIKTALGMGGVRRAPAGPRGPRTQDPTGE